MNISILALEGVFDTGLATVLDAFATANELSQMANIQSPGYNISVVGVRPQVHSSLGMTVPVIATTEGPSPDWVIIPAIGYKMPDPLLEALAREDVQESCHIIREWSEAGAGIAAACIGTFVLAESGVLNQFEATTTWWLTPLFRQRYPEVRLDSNRIIVPSGKFLTAGAGLSHIDLALWMIRQNNPELASLVAKYLIVDSRPSQSVYIISDHLAHTDPMVERFDHWVRDNLNRSLTLDEAAAELATSKRTLSRRMSEVVGKTPIAYIQDLRVERAVHLLKTSNHSVDRIAEMVGYNDGVTLRTLLRRRLGKGVRELRDA
ncbi:AraC family transcriptional regulator [Hahella sp. CCB-MM4]|nr:AraC family transcriptional regulator [Hahella sp. CCB-MM4]